MTEPIVSGVDASDRLLHVVADLPATSPHRGAIEAVRTWALGTDARGALQTRLDANTAALAAVAAALTANHTLEMERARVLRPLLEAVASRATWAVWLQSPGRGREILYLIGFLILVLTRPDLLPRLLGASP